MKKIGSFLLKAAYVLSFFVIFQFLLPAEIRDKIIKRDNVLENGNIVYNTIPFHINEYRVLETFYGTMTGYGPDCAGCGGKTGCQPRQDVRNGNIYYNDVNYGKLRIVAADSDIACGTIVRITASRLYSESFIAIVLDRGGAITGKKFDLLFESNKVAMQASFQRNVKYEVLRYGWK